MDEQTATYENGNLLEAYTGGSSGSTIKWQYTNTDYDIYGRTTGTSIDGLAELEYTYSKGNLTNIQRTASNITQGYNFVYDVWGNKTSISVGDLELASYTFADENGNLESMTYGNGDTVSYTYDHLDRVKTQTNTAADGTVIRTLTYTYTGDGQLYSVYDSKTEITQYCTYDALDRVVASQHGSMATSYEYEDRGRFRVLRY